MPRDVSTSSSALASARQDEGRSTRPPVPLPKLGSLDTRQERVRIICDALDSPDPVVIRRHASIIANALAEGFDAQRFFSRLAPVLRQHGVKTPPSLHTWRAIEKELNRRAAAALSSRGN